MMKVLLPQGMRTALISSKKYALCLALALICLYFASGIYSISSNEIGVHQRFGCIVNKNVHPGLHYALPWPFNRVDKVPVMDVKRIAIDDFMNIIKFSDLFSGDMLLKTVSKTETYGHSSKECSKHGQYGQTVPDIKLHSYRFLSPDAVITA